MNAHWWDPSVRLWNTMSNLTYPVAGYLVAWVMGIDAGYAMAFLLSLLGIGSGVYHWFGTPASRNADWFGMFVVIAGLATYAADPGNPEISQWMLGVSLLVAVALTYGWRQTGKNGILGLGMFLVALPVLGSGVPMAVATGLLSLTLFGGGLVLQRQDKQVGNRGHGWWHVLTALGFVSMFVAITLTV